MLSAKPETPTDTHGGGGGVEGPRGRLGGHIGGTGEPGCLRGHVASNSNTAWTHAVGNNNTAWAPAGIGASETSGYR